MRVSKMVSARRWATGQRKEGERHDSLVWAPRRYVSRSGLVVARSPQPETDTGLTPDCTRPVAKDHPGAERVFGTPPPGGYRCRRGTENQNGRLDKRLTPAILLPLAHDRLGRYTLNLS
jgi:hypothetical protein